MPAKFDHVHLHAADPEKTLAFYTKYFDAVDIGEIVAGGNRIVRMQVGGVNVFLYDRPCAQADQRPENTPMHHMGFVIDDLDSTAAALKADGYEFLVEPQTSSTGDKFTFVLGPDNVCVEIIERP